ncbi:MAG: PQQ-binding-like beta-propeller repeat protein [Candidatus Pelagibacter sp.]
MKLKSKLKDGLRGSLVAKKYFYFVLFLFLLNCSLNPNSKFWTKEKKILVDKNSTTVLLMDQKKSLNEFNQNFKISLPKNLEIKTNHQLNNDGFINFDANLEKMSKYNFKTISSFSNFEPEILLDKNQLFYFDSKGSIIKFDNNSNVVWRQNYYSKQDKKLQPILFFGKSGEDLFVADNIANYYVVNKNTGKLKWKKKHSSSFNSQIKTFEDKALVIDMENQLRCFSLETGELIWSVKTQKSLLRSQKKQSLILKNDKAYFSNSIGDVTAVNISNGKIIWQTPTQSNVSFGKTYFLKLSDIVSDNESIFVSNNNNQFFSIDLLTGSINWKQDLSSELRPALIDDYLVTISDKGLLIIMNKETGQIIRVNDLFKNIKKKRKKNYQPTGFLVSKFYIYLSTNNGRILVVNFKEGKIEKMLKLDNNKLQRPVYFNKSLYIAKDNSIVRLN